MKAAFADEEKAHRTTGELRTLPAMNCVARIGRPLFKLINRPWKMCPIGVVFGLGSDTASEISLLGISALAPTDPHRLPSPQLILLPLLFTAGMTAVDSLDSVCMLMAYTFPQRVEAQATGETGRARWWYVRRWELWEMRASEEGEEKRKEQARGRIDVLRRADQDSLLGISVALTVISIAVALLISVTEFVGLALHASELRRYAVTEASRRWEAAAACLHV